MSPSTVRHNPLIGFRGILLALSVALGTTMVLLLLLGSSPLGALGSFFGGPFSSGLAWGNTLNQASVLILTGLAASIAFGSGSFNLGGEGQVYLGGFAALAAALVLPPVLGWVGLILAVLAGIAAGGLWGGLSGALKARWEADELITTFLLSAAVIPVVNSLITSPTFGAATSYLITSRQVDAAFQLPPLLPPSNLHVGALAVLPLAVVLAVLVNSTPWGYRLRLLGRSRAFAHYAGIPLGRYSLLPLGLSGALHGLAGALGVLGTQHALVQGFSYGWGWNGIAVALIARTNPLAVIPAALLFTFLDQASRMVVLQGQFPFQLSALFQAAILFFITAELGTAVRRRR